VTGPPAQDPDVTPTEPIPALGPFPGVAVLYENGRAVDRRLFAREGPMRIGDGDTWVELVHDERGFVASRWFGDVHASGPTSRGLRAHEPFASAVLRVGEIIAVADPAIDYLRRVGVSDGFDYPVAFRGSWVTQGFERKKALLLVGPRGTDRVRLARTIHAHGRPGRPFVHLSSQDLGLPASPTPLQQRAAGERFRKAVDAAETGTLVLEDFDRLPRRALVTLGCDLKDAGAYHAGVWSLPRGHTPDVWFVLLLERDHPGAIMSELGGRFPGDLYDCSREVFVWGLAASWHAIPQYVDWAVRVGGSDIGLSAAFVEACIARFAPLHQEALFAAIEAAVQIAAGRGVTVLDANDLPMPSVGSDGPRCDLETFEPDESILADAVAAPYGAESRNIIPIRKNVLRDLDRRGKPQDAASFTAELIYRGFARVLDRVVRVGDLLVSDAPELAHVADAVAAVRTNFPPLGPPRCPITESFFQPWALFDCTANAYAETIGSVARAVLRRLPTDPIDLALLDVWTRSRLGLYVLEEAEGEIVHLRELVTGVRVRALALDAASGTPGTVWLARVLSVSDACIVVHGTPYEIHGTTMSDWNAYFARVLGDRTGADRARAYARWMKWADFGSYWHRYVCSAFVEGDERLIRLQGTPA